MKTLAPIWQFDIRAQAVSLKTNPDDFIKQAVPVYQKLQTLDRETRRMVLTKAGKAICPFNRLQAMEMALCLVGLSDKQLLRHWKAMQADSF